MLRRRSAVVVATLGLAVLALPTTPFAVAQSPEGGDMINAPQHELLQGFRWRAIGPVGQGGRVDDIAVRPEDPKTYFVGFATGGLWKTTNNGTTFRPVFDTYGTHSIGAIGLAPSDPDVVYIGTGESNNRQSSSFGDGVYKSTDGGETFTHIGLRETQSVARVVVHPNDPDVVWVAANGQLFAANEERGVFKSSDGGATWRKVLYVDENTGATDLVIDPSDPGTLFAATYQRRRTACCFVGGGPGSGIWRSSDGGENWTRLEGNGLPNGTMGRAALAMTPADPDVVYAQIEVAADRENPLTEAELAAWEEASDEDRLPADPEWNGIWRSSDKGDSWVFRSNQNGRPMYFSQIRASPQDPQLVYVVDQRVHKSRDGGITFERLDGYGHVDQHGFWIDPDDQDHMMIGNDGSVDVTWDQGETWESLRTWAVGQPYHASVDMRRPYFVCTGLQDNGSWCGPSSVREGPILAQDWYGVGGGDGFYTAVDPTDPNTFYSESQNGNIRRGDLRSGEIGSIRPRTGGGRGGGRGGRGGRGGAPPNIAPVPDPDTEIRWNWNTPFIISPHNPDTIHAGANRFFTSRNRGDTWTMGPDLSKNIDRDEVQIMGVYNAVVRCRQNQPGVECIPSRNDGVSNWSTIASLTESSLVPGVLWAGTDDGNIQVSRDGGASWNEVSRNLPGGTTQYYVSRVEASHHDAATAYVSIDGHKSGDLQAYVYVTRDYGESWSDIAADLPRYGNVNTIRQDPVNPSLLYAGTEFGFFVSLDDGGSWERFMPNLPVVRIDDVLVHPRDNDLVLSTHGRSIQILDDVTALQAMTPEVLDSDVHLFQPRPAVLWKSNIRRDRSVTGDKNWTGDNAPAGTAIQYYLGSEAAGAVDIEITDAVTGDVVRNVDGTTHAGLNRVQWNLRANPEGENANQGPQVWSGIFRVTLRANGMEQSALLDVLEDVWMTPLR
jgi:photosystem II stability/assembly factor-like uncharacterized protein